MPQEQCTFDYAIIRVVPRVEREEFINAGAIVWCQAAEYLDALVALDEARLSALGSHIDIELVRQNLASIPTICAGGEAAGAIGELSKRERFHWLVAPRSTIVQMSPVHSGLTSNPSEALAHLLNTMVRVADQPIVIPAKAGMTK